MSELPLRILALDYGQKNFGLATFIEGEDLFPSVLPVLKVTGEPMALSFITKTLLEHEINLILLGHPIDEEGRRTWITLKVEAFLEQLKALTEVPIQLIDEYGTSDLAQERISSETSTRKSKKVRVDSLAAGLLIEKFLRERAL